MYIGIFWLPRKNEEVLTMIKIYLSNEQGSLQEKTEITTGCWIKLISPTEKEINHVANKLQIPLEFLKDPLDEEERSRIEKDGDNILIIVNVPLMTMDENEIPIYDTIPLGIIIANNCFVTVCLKDNPIFHTFSEKKVKNFFTYKRTRFSYQILYSMSTSYLKYLKQISKQTDAIENKLHKSIRTKNFFHC